MDSETEDDACLDTFFLDFFKLAMFKIIGPSKTDHSK
jgi:hypothetical protein